MNYYIIENAPLRAHDGSLTRSHRQARVTSTTKEKVGYQHP